MKLKTLEISKKYGSLTVIEKISKRSQYRLRCVCGTLVDCKASEITSGNKQSCGCLRRKKAGEMGKKFGKVYGGLHQNQLPDGLDSAHRLRISYKHDAKRRGILFDISKEDFTHLTSLSCYYCGDSPSQIIKGRQIKNKTDYVYNGLDRIRNDKGYCLENVVPCCMTCNRAKHTSTQRDFIAWAHRVASKFR